MCACAFLSALAVKDSEEKENKMRKKKEEDAFFFFAFLLCVSSSSLHDRRTQCVSLWRETEGDRAGLAGERSS